MTVTPHFNGSDYDPDIDHQRLSKQLDRVRSLMGDGRWRSLPEIEHATGDPQASVSAQLRHLRKPRFGSYIVNKRRRHTDGGLWEYQLQAPAVTDE